MGIRKMAQTFTAGTASGGGFEDSEARERTQLRMDFYRRNLACRAREVGRSCPILHTVPYPGLPHLHKHLRRMQGLTRERPCPF